MVARGASLIERPRARKRTAAAGQRGRRAAGRSFRCVQADWAPALSGVTVEAPSADSPASRPRRPAPFSPSSTDLSPRFPAFHSPPVPGFRARTGWQGRGWTDPSCRMVHRPAIPEGIAEKHVTNHASNCSQYQKASKHSHAHLRPDWRISGPQLARKCAPKSLLKKMLHERWFQIFAADIPSVP